MHFNFRNPTSVVLLQKYLLNKTNYKKKTISNMITYPSTKNYYIVFFRLRRRNEVERITCNIIVI